MPKKASSKTETPPKIVFVAQPISVRIREAVAMTGMSRSRLYELIKSGEIQIAKDGSSTLILVESLRAAIARRAETQGPR